MNENPAFCFISGAISFFIRKKKRSSTAKEEESHGGSKGRDSFHEVGSKIDESGIQKLDNRTKVKDLSKIF
jgi:hypothetical protein